MRRSALHTAAAILLARDVNATWSQFHGDAGHTGQSGVTVPTTGRACLVWQTVLPSLTYSSPVLTSNSLIIGTGRAPAVSALNITSGAVLWQSIDAGSMTGTAAVSGASPVLYAALDGSASRMVALQADSGNVVWSTDLNADASSSVLLFQSNGSDVVLACAGSSVLACRGDSGDVAWSTDTGSSMFATPSYFNPPLACTSTCARHGCVYIGTGNGSVLALDAASGALVWQFESYWDITATAVVSGDLNAFPLGVVFIGNGGGTVLALDACTGAQTWSYAAPSGVSGSPTLALHASGGGGDLILPLNDGHMVSLDAATGDVNWITLHDGAILSSPAVDATGNVYFAVASFLCGVNGTNGVVMWCYDAPSEILASPAVGEDGVIYAASAGAFPGNNAVFAVRAC